MSAEFGPGIRLVAPSIAIYPGLNWVRPLFILSRYRSWITSGISERNHHSGWDHEPGELDSATLCAREAYEDAGLGPEDLGVIELHDASAVGELIAYESLGLCQKGEAGNLIDEDVTANKITFRSTGTFIQAWASDLPG